MQRGERLDLSPTRRLIVDALRSRPSISVDELMAATGVCRSTLRRHLLVIKQHAATYGLAR